jgi:hypothetical protein
MNHSPRQYYIVDLYHRPTGYREPVVRAHHRIASQSDAEAIRAAKAMFAELDSPSLTGFAVRAIGSQRFGEQAIYREEKPRSEALPTKHAAD